MKKHTTSLLALLGCCATLGISQPWASVALSTSIVAQSGQPAVPPNHPPMPSQPGQPNQPGMPPGHPAAPPQLPAGHPAMPGENPELVLSPDWPIGKPEDVASVDAIVKAYYDTVSGAKGQPRDWDRLRSLMLPEMQFFSTRLAGQRALPIVIKLNDYIEVNRKYFERGGYFEKEVNRKTDFFNNIAQVFSTYESRHQAEEPTPYSRGINSMQLLFDGERWWIASITWASEDATHPIPPKYSAPAVAVPATK